MNYKIKEEDYRKVYESLDNGRIANAFKEYHVYKELFDSTEKKYPRLNMTVKIEEPKTLINDDGLLDKDKMSTPIEKFLYAILWKQGDLHKIKGIVAGLSNESELSEMKSGKIFYQFGKHLADEKEPIIDINVLTAYGHYSGDVSALIKNGISTSPKGTELIQRYINWFKKVTKDKDADFRFIVDRIMFAIGKHIKN